VRFGPAERRWGELYKPAIKAQGRRTDLVTDGDQVSGPPTLAEMGVSKRESVKWQARAAIPAGEFEAALAAGKSTDPLIKNSAANGAKSNSGNIL
jgi:hypothetical protein